MLAVVVPRSRVKEVKTLLEERGVFGKRIDRAADDTAGFTLVTNLRADNSHDGREKLGFLDDDDEIEITAAPVKKGVSSPHGSLAAFLAATRSSPGLSDSLKHDLPKRVTIYSPLLLLPAGSLSSPSWRSFLASTPSFLPALARATKTTHIAISSPIPADSLQRLPSPTFLLNPTSSSVTSPLWVTTKQNGIFQTWPVQHCMFSRGNVKEKARVLGFPEVAGNDVADLYAGIGYFAFSYLRAGARRVWCWEINEHSCEALRRGLKLNGWGEERVRVYNESNEHAAERLRQDGEDVVGKMAHVNLGYLPSSRGAWDTARRICKTGGWVHVHENTAERGVDRRKEEVVREFNRMESEGGRAGRWEWRWTERVKTFAPGVVHVVFDLRKME